MSALNDALAAVAAEMRKQAKTLAEFCPDSSGSPLGKQIDAWADRIEQAIATHQEVTVAWYFEYCGTPMLWFRKPADFPSLTNVRPLIYGGPAPPPVAQEALDALANVRRMAEKWNASAKAEGFGGGNAYAKEILAAIKDSP